MGSSNFPSRNFRFVQFWIISNMHYHIELKRDPLRFTGSKQVSADGGKCYYFYDSTNNHLLCVSTPSTGGLIVTKNALNNSKSETDRFNVKFQQEKIQIINAKYSYDERYLALQLSPTQIDFINLQDRSIFSQCCKKSNNNTILDYYWTYVDNLFLITTNGIELYQFPLQPKKKELKLIKDHKITVNWYLYSAKHRVLLMASGLTIQGYHFTSNAVIKIPKFTIEKDKNSNNKNNNEILNKNEFVISQIYGKLFCIQIDSNKEEIILYQLTREIVIKRTTIPIHTKGQITIQIVDNLIVIHNIETKVAMMFDIKDLDNIDFPVAAPLPIYTYSNDTQQYEIEVYTKNWLYIQPNIIIDTNDGLIYYVHLNLNAIILTFTDKKRLIDFLMKRTNSKELLLNELKSIINDGESLFILADIFDLLNLVLVNSDSSQSSINGNVGSPNSSNITYSSPFYSSSKLRRIASLSNLTLSNSNNSNNNNNKNEPVAIATPITSSSDEWGTQSIIGLPTVSNNYEDINNNNIINGSPNFPTKTTENKKNKGYVIVTQSDMYTHVFLPLEEEKGLDNKFIIAVLTEYIRSLNYYHIQVEPFIYELLINFLVRNNRFYQLHQLLQYHVVSDSVHVACQLLSLENTYPPSYQLALDMLKRLHTHDQIVEVLLTTKHVIPAIRFMRSHKNRIPISPARFLEVALETGDKTLFYTAYKYFEEKNELKDKETAIYTKSFKEYFDVPTSPSINM